MAKTTLEQLESRLRGYTVRPGSEGYEEGRKIWNAMIDRKPSVLVRCLGTHDVIEALAYAREHELTVAVRGGGHNVAGNAVCDDGLVIDLSCMRTVRTDPSTKSTRVAGGALLGDVDFDTSRYGLAVSAGIVSHTGVGGLALGGGFGWISRKHGLTVDNLISADVVTADGRTLTASATENPDLFWAIRGGGGNFGVVTSFEFRCAEIGREVFSGLIVHPFRYAKEYLRFHRDYVRTLPDETTVWMVIRQAPPLPFLPEEVHGQMVVAVPFVHLGDPSEGEQLIRPLREFGAPCGEAVGMHPWTGWQSMFDALNSHGMRNYWKSHYLEELSDEAIDVVLKYAENLPGPQCEVFIPHMEGAPSRVPEGETAYAFRRAPFVLNIHTRWEKAEEDERYIGWARDFFTDTKRFARGVYVNFLSDEGQERVRDAYSAEAWRRLQEIKKKYDGDNVFRMNQNIPPAK